MLSIKYAIVVTNENYNDIWNYIDKAIAKNEKKASEPKLKKVGEIIAGSVVGGALALLFPIPTSVAVGGFLIGNGIIQHQGEKVRKKWKSWGDWTLYSLEDIPQEFVFEETPEPQTVYFSCNYKPNYYYPVADFQEKIEEIKQEAICDMMEGLGARNLVVCDATTERKSINVDVAATKTKVKGSFDHTNEFGEEFEQKTEFNRPLEIKASSNPYIFDNKILSKHQERRIGNRIKTDEFKWTTEKESCFGASVAESFSQSGFKIGGKYKAYKKKTFKIFVEYWDI